MHRYSLYCNFSHFFNGHTALWQTGRPCCGAKPPDSREFQMISTTAKLLRKPADAPEGIQVAPAARTSPITIVSGEGYRQVSVMNEGIATGIMARGNVSAVLSGNQWYNPLSGICEGNPLPPPEVEQYQGAFTLDPPVLNHFFTRSPESRPAPRGETWRGGGRPWPHRKFSPQFLTAFLQSSLQIEIPD